MKPQGKEYIVAIPGYYFDPKTKKHFKIPPKNDISSQYLKKQCSEEAKTEATPACNSKVHVKNIAIQVLQRQLISWPCSIANQNFIESFIRNICEKPESFIILKSAEIFQKRTNISDLYISPEKDYIISTSRAFGMNISEKYQKLDATLMTSSFIDNEGFFDSQKKIFPYGINGPQTLRVVNSFSNLRFYEYPYHTPPLCHKPYRFYVSSYDTVTTTIVSNRERPPLQTNDVSTPSTTTSELLRDENGTVHSAHSFDEYYPALACSDWQLNAPYIITKRQKSIDSFCINPVKPILACVYRETIQFLDMLTISNRTQCDLLFIHVRTPSRILPVYDDDGDDASRPSTEPAPPQNSSIQKLFKPVSYLVTDVLSMAFSENGKILVLGCRNGDIERVSVLTPKYSNVIHQSKQLSTFHTSHGLRHFSTHSRSDDQYGRRQPELDNRARKRNYMKSKHRGPIPNNLSTNESINYSVCDVKFVPNSNNFFISSHYNDKLLMWDSKLGKIVISYPGHRNNHKYIRININIEANILYCGCTDKTVRIWSLWNGELLKVLHCFVDNGIGLGGLLGGPLTRHDSPGSLPRPNISSTTTLTSNIRANYEFHDHDEDRYHHHNSYSSEYDNSLPATEDAIYHSTNSTNSHVLSTSERSRRRRTDSTSSNTFNSALNRSSNSLRNEESSESQSDPLDNVFTTPTTTTNNSNDTNSDLDLDKSCCVVPPIPIFVGTPYWSLNYSAITDQIYPSSLNGTPQCPHFASNNYHQRHLGVGEVYDPTSNNEGADPQKLTNHKASFTLCRKNPNFIVGFGDKLFAFY